MRLQPKIRSSYLIMLRLTWRSAFSLGSVAISDASVIQRAMKDLGVQEILRKSKAFGCSACFFSFSFWRQKERRKEGKEKEKSQGRTLRLATLAQGPPA